MRQQRKQRKALEKRRKQTKKAREEKTKLQAVRQQAVEQVDAAVMKSKQRRSHPVLVLLLLIVVIVLSGAAVWFYRQYQVDDKQTRISQLQNELATFANEKRMIENQKQTEDAKYQTMALNNATIRVPKEWTVQPSQYPSEEQVIGDDNVSLHITRSKSRDSSDKYIPRVDYLWQSQTTGNKQKISTKSLHCNRFDTLGNNLSDTRRQHNGFTVYCDTNPEKVVIAVLNQPQKYGNNTDDTYFIVEVNDLQQLNFDDLTMYLESYTAQ